MLPFPQQEFQIFGIFLSHLPQSGPPCSSPSPSWLSQPAGLPAPAELCRTVLMEDLGQF